MSEKELQEKLETERFKGVYAKIDANYELVNNKIDANHKELNDKIDKNQENTLLVLKQILEQTKKTNGRVTKLEDETQFARTISKYPKLAITSVVGTLALIVMLGLGTIFKIF